ncbi:hypothetical protein BGW36DRAFT_28007 [Talaromyces proteolyticus]|uniref:Uncharacterized protein n=1 Tax=Talaromyces proteolyticus TaxID=1131652 RepID=A0AAD4KJ20_9EURO|nr:uncharacterized protein BGW36DRAFT_28007 [Talaromyces proteolyticus]KAH8692809.1 hypothetical protein BGW36DRAFT_28007 [Talaromyces proteolyticus]
MITNGRLIWLEEQEIWVLVDSLPAPAELPRAGNNNTYHVAQNSNNPLIQYYDPVAREYESEDELPPSYESHQFMSRRHLTIPPPTNQPHRRPHRGRDSGRGRTQWASIAERLELHPRLFQRDFHDARHVRRLPPNMIPYYWYYR